MLKSQIIAKLEELKKGSLSEWELVEGTWGTEVLVRYGWQEDTDTGSVTQDEWVILVGGDPAKNFDSTDMQEVATYLIEIEAYDLNQMLENIVENCETEQYINVSDDMFTEAVGGSEVLAEKLEKMVKEDNRLEWWKQGAQYVDRHGKMVTLDQPVILPANRFRDPGEAERVGE